MEDKKPNLRVLSVTDEMALLRTILANERTFLSYFRTFLGTFAAGAGLIVLGQHEVLVGCGFVLIAISPFILVVGIVRTARSTKRLNSITEVPAKSEEIKSA